MMPTRIITMRDHGIPTGAQAFITAMHTESIRKAVPQAAVIMTGIRDRVIRAGMIGIPAVQTGIVIGDINADR